MILRDSALGPVEKAATRGIIECPPRSRKLEIGQLLSQYYYHSIIIVNRDSTMER